MWPFKNTLDLLKCTFHTTNNYRVPFYFYYNIKLTEMKYVNLSHMKLSIFWYLLKYRKGKFIRFNPINACVLVAWSYPTVCDPMDCCLPSSSVHGILQARILEWVAIPSSGDLLDPGLNLSLLYHRQILYCLIHQGSPKCLWWTL